MKKRRVLIAVTISTLLMSATTGAGLVNLAVANPYWDGGYTAPPADMQTQTITIVSPRNNTVYASNNLTLGFSVSLNSTPTQYYVYISWVYYKASWQNSNVSVYDWSWNESMNPYDYDPYLTEFPYQGNLTEIPEGRQNITVTAIAQGSYIKGIVRYQFVTNITFSVIFIINTVSEHFPVVPITAASMVTFVGTSLLLIYFKKRRREAEPT